jgi:para-aminobenzoate synthetase/4-amino-4-deoxychorismate lyase
LNTPLPTPSIDTLLHQLSSEKDFVFLDTSKTTPDENRSLLFTNPITKLTFNASQDPRIFFDTIQRYLNQGYFLAGWFAYEFGYALEASLRSLLATLGDRPLAHLGVYRAPFIIDHTNPRQDAPLQPFANCPRQPLNQYQINNLRPSLSPTDYFAGLEQIKKYIVAGDTYQVNYTLKLLFDFTGSPESLYRDLRCNQPVSYSAYLDLDGNRILSFSPELFFRKTANHCQVRPMKGTMPRGRTPYEDQQFAVALQNDPKNRSENVMIVDLLRNDLGKISAMGGVESTALFTVETYTTLHQMTSTITGRISENVGLTELFQALYPCGSVTGAPKIRTMEIIHELERQPRGIYTGGIGYIAPTGDAVFNVPIRTIVLTGNQGEMGIGSGIVHDSNPEAEWQECLLKGQFLSSPRPDCQLIETILWLRDTGFWLMDRHIARLAASAGYLGYTLNTTILTQQLNEATTTAVSTSLKIRILLHQDGTLKIRAIPCDPPAALDFSILPATEGTLPKITVSKRPTHSSWPFLYHKTTRRELYTSERQLSLDRGYFEVIFTNEKEEITEGSISNILIRQGQQLFTPPTSCGLLAGVCRGHLLDLHPQLITERIMRHTDLLTADAIYLVNSIRGIVEVSL